MLSPGANVRVVDKENERGASPEEACAEATAAISMNIAAQRADFPKGDFIECLAKCSSGRCRESWDCRPVAATAAGDAPKAQKEARGGFRLKRRDRVPCR